MMEAVDELNEEGAYLALYCSLGALREISDESRAMNILVGDLDEALSVSPSPSL
ncbi:MAG: hypothetical protein LBR53_03040 [Deltaproteobacteria bacterium]|jgi:hypothetical protein|nr:hypothetical protein [Deltaproteobacteria bacterium]